MEKSELVDLLQRPGPLVAGEATVVSLWWPWVRRCWLMVVVIGWWLMIGYDLLVVDDC